MKPRLYRFDNLKFLLMFLVVFGHVLEFVPGYGNTSDIYRVIYSFHMPAFIFISGYFSKPAPKKVLTTYIWPYILLQALYLAYAYYVIAPWTEPKTFQYQAPYWMLWYLPAMSGMHLILPIFITNNKYARLTFLTGMSIIALVCGYDNSISIGYTVSKILVFFPFFLLGYYMKNSPVKYFELRPRYKNIIFAISCPLALFCGYLISQKDHISYNIMLGQYPYDRFAYNPLIRAILLGMALIWLIAMLSCPLLDKKIPVVSFIGKFTFPIFVFHGLVLRTMGKYGLYGKLPFPNLINAVLITIAILLLFGNPVFDKIFRYLFTLEPLEKLLRKAFNKKKNTPAKEN